MLNNVEIRVRNTEHGEYLCLTDLAKVVGGNTGKIIGNWMSLIGTIEYLKEWEMKYNADNFNVLRYQDIRMNSGTIRFTMSAKKWIEETAAIGIISEAGRYGGTFAHNAIALEFCAAVSPAFKLGVYVDYIELKDTKMQKWLNTYRFYLDKIDDFSLEANRMTRTLKASLEEEE